MGWWGDISFSLKNISSLFWNCYLPLGLFRDIFGKNSLGVYLSSSDFLGFCTMMYIFYFIMGEPIYEIEQPQSLRQVPV